MRQGSRFITNESTTLLSSSFVLIVSSTELIHDNTEIFFFYLSELVHSAAKSGCLTKAKLRGLLAEYGPIRVNRVVSSGGLCLVELCRAHHVREATLLACVQELVQHHGALVNGQSH